MKLLLSLGVVILLQITHAKAESAPLNIYRTINGTEYHLVNNMPPEMGASYIDPEGLVWGDMMMLGEALWFTSAGRGIGVCGQIMTNYGPARLPKKEEILRLRESMSLVANPNALVELEQNGLSDNSTYDVSKPALPNIGKYPNTDLTLSYWTMSEHNDGGHFAYSSGGGKIESLQSNYYMPFRCVVDAD